MTFVIRARMFFQQLDQRPGDARRDEELRAQNEGRFNPIRGEL
jgi:hypothetical protein